MMGTARFNERTKMSNQAMLEVDEHSEHMNACVKALCYAVRTLQEVEIAYGAQPDSSVVVAWKRGVSALAAVGVTWDARRGWIFTLKPQPER
jgi:hypothetical protein